MQQTKVNEENERQELLKKNPQNISIDEISLKKGYDDFLTVISNEDRVLEVIDGRDNDSVKPILEKIAGNTIIESVTIDMSKTYNSVIKAVIPTVTKIIDRFHIMKNLNKNMIDINKKSYKMLPKDERKPYSKIWQLLCKSPKDLNKNGNRLIKAYLEFNPDMKPVYLLVQEFREILLKSKHKIKEIIELDLKNWINKASTCLGEFCKTLTNWFDGIVNACIYPQSNARQEGLNNLIKLVKRRGRGYSNITNFKLSIQAESS